jgi:cytoskeletal protein CcmA (bactofilin family)
MAVKKDSHTEDVTIISGGVKLEGNLQSEGNVRIDGSVVGNVIVKGNLTLGENCNIHGEIKANNIIMGGKVEGKVTSMETLRLEAKSILKGDLITKKLIVEEGAVFEGHSSMNSREVSSQISHE